MSSSSTNPQRNQQSSNSKKWKKLDLAHLPSKETVAESAKIEGSQDDKRVAGTDNPDKRETHNDRHRSEAPESGNDKTSSNAQTQPSTHSSRPSNPQISTHSQLNFNPHDYEVPTTDSDHEEEHDYDTADPYEDGHLEMEHRRRVKRK